MSNELKAVRNMQAEVRAIRKLAVASVKDARTALRMARAFVLLREAEGILCAEVKKLADGTVYRSDLARCAVEWNLNSAYGRLVLARDVLKGVYDNGGPVKI